MTLFKKQDEMAQEILTKHRGKALAIVKATRAGATFSLLKRACELGQKTVIVAPYIEIFDKTVQEVIDSFKKKPKVARIAKNEDICRKVSERIGSNPALKSLPFHFRPSCKNCKYNNPESCKLQEILASDWDVLGLTYAKLRTLCISQSATALDLLTKIKLPDNLILDEFVTGIIVASPSVEILEPHAYLQNEFDYELRIFKGLKNDSIEAMFWPAIAVFAQDAEAEGKNLREREHKVYANPIKRDCGTFFEDNFAECWNLIEHLVLEGRDTKVLQELLQIVASDTFFIIKKDGKVSIKPVLNLDDISRGSSYLKSFALIFFSKGKLVALVDACLPDLDLKHSLGLDVETFQWGDPLNTNQSQLVICDTRKIGEIDFFKSMKLQAELKKTITALSELHGANTILLATQNKDMWKVIEVWRNKGDIPEEIMTTYYRSDISRGFTPDRKRRNLILIGAPYLPKEAYLPETYISAGQALDLQTAYKKSDMKSAFINLIGRVKDPRGIDKSIVYAIGITSREVRAFVTQEDVRAPLIFEFLVKGADSLDFEQAARSFLHCEEPRTGWKSLEKDLPVLTRILRVCRTTDEEHTLSEILPKDTRRVQEFVENYPDVFEQFNIKIIKEPRGYRLKPL